MTAAAPACSSCSAESGQECEPYCPESVGVVGENEPYPQVHGPASAVEHLRTALVNHALAHLSQWPQYGPAYFDGWRPAEITKRVVTKLGVAFEPGDVVLVSPVTRTDVHSRMTWTSAYSGRNKITTSVDPRFVREIVIDGGVS
jgi:hypothetical protein